MEDKAVERNRCMLKIRVLGIAVFLIAMAMASPLAFAEGIVTGSVKGVVTDKATKERLAGATIVITSITDKKSYTAISDVKGKYRMQKLPKGAYSAIFFYADVKEKVPRFKIRAGREKNLNMSMDLSELSDELMIIKGRPLIDTTKTTSGMVIGREFIRNLPIPHSRYYGTMAGPRTGASNYKARSKTDFRKAAYAPLSTFSIDVDTASYSNVRRHINESELPPAAAVKIEELVNYFDYQESAPSGGVPFKIATEVANAPWDQKHKLVRIGIQGRKLAKKALPPSNLVFLIDVSGSMQSPDKLELLIKSFQMLVETLREQDRVAIVVYAGAAGQVLASTRGSEKEKILRALDQLEAGGSTAGGDGIHLAYSIASKHFIKGGKEMEGLPIPRPLVKAES